jgi:AraC-like DNA-binding protein
MAMLDHIVERLDDSLAPLVSRCVGYRFEGLAPGIHRGLPAPKLTVVISLADPLEVQPGGASRLDSHQMLLAGMHTEPAMIFHDGSQYGIQLDLTPRGAHCLLGVLAAELTAQVVPLADVFAGADELLERSAEATSWQERFGILDEMLTRNMVHHEPTTTDLAWCRIVRSSGNIRIDDVAAHAGWGRSHLRERFRSEYGFSPKEIARMARFARATRLLQQPDRILADVAATCGYADQSHMTRDWKDFAGCSPLEWMATEDLPFVQDDNAVLAAS